MVLNIKYFLHLSDYRKFHPFEIQVKNPNQLFHFTCVSMCKNDINEVQKEIIEIGNEIKWYLEEYPNYARIIILGLTGSGKSSLTCSLANQKLTIEKYGNKFTMLTGNGIVAGCKPGTEKPKIYVDDKNRLLLCDCPGFEDVDGFTNEIRNAFADDQILYSKENYLKLKILLVVSAPEFSTRRGKVVTNTILRMKRMFPNPNDFKNGIGIVITKGEPNNSGKDYFKQLKVNADESLKKWCDYFIAFEEQVFTFPLASIENVGKQYIFDDYEKIIDFITSDYLINPPHKIAISEEALVYLNAIKEQNLRDVINIVEDIFLLMNEQYRKSGNSATLKIWLNNMHLLLNQNITKISDFRTSVQKIITSNDEFNKLFQQMDDYEAFDSFVDRIGGIDANNSYLFQTIIYLAKSAIQELEKLSSFSEYSEIQAQMIQEKKEMIRLYEEKEVKLQKQIDQLTKQANVNILTINNLKEDLKNQRREADEQLNKMRDELFSKSNIFEAQKKECLEQINQLKYRITNLQCDLEREKNKPPQVIVKTKRRCLIC